MSVTVTAAEVNKLRQQTGAPMMDCRQALVESNGDFEAAIDYLRKKGQKVAAKRSDREANEGVVVAKTSADGKFGIILNLTSETDFVSKNQDFVNFAVALADTAIANNVKTVEELKATQFEGAAISDKLLEMVGKIGEKIDVTKIERIDSDSVVAYNHAGYRVAVLVGMNKAQNEGIEAAGRDVAMQIAAMNPVAIDADSVAPEVVARERSIVIDTMKQDPKMSDKTDDMLEKIAVGKLNAFFKENTLMAQPFVKDAGKSVAEYLKSVESDLKVVSFNRVAIG